MLSQDNLSHFILFFLQQASGESFTCKGKIPSTQWSIWLDIVYIFLKSAMEDCIGQFVAVRGTGSVSWRMALWDCFKDVIASFIRY